MGGVLGAQADDQVADVNTAYGHSSPFSGTGEEAQDTPPPPYESVVMHDGVGHLPCCLT